jgi:enoyl-CoA hydratase
MSPKVSYSLEEPVAIITMDDQKANALSFAMFDELNAAFDRAIADDVVVVLTGRSTVFCAGFDLKSVDENGKLPNGLVDEGLAFALRIMEHPRPIVMACAGHAVAMGALLLLCSDYRIGAEGEYRIVTSEVSIGMVFPWGGIELARQRLAPSHFTRALNLAEPFSPVAAVEAGFLDEVTGRGELIAAATRKATELAQLDPVVYAKVKSQTLENAIRAIRAGERRDHEARDA